VERLFLGGDAEGGVGGAAAGIAAATFDDLQEALAEGLAVELEELAAFITVVEDVMPAEEGMLVSGVLSAT